MQITPVEKCVCNKLMGNYLAVVPSKPVRAVQLLGRGSAYGSTPAYALVEAVSKVWNVCRIAQRANHSTHLVLYNQSFTVLTHLLIGDNFSIVAIKMGHPIFGVIDLELLAKRYLADESCEMAFQCG